MGFLATVKDFCKSLVEEDVETPIYTPSEGLEREVYGCIARYSWLGGVGDISPNDHIIKDLGYDTDLLSHVALKTDLWKKFRVDVPENMNVVGEIYRYIKDEMEKRE